MLASWLPLQCSRSWQHNSRATLPTSSGFVLLHANSDLSCLATFKRLVKTELYSRAYLRWFVTTRTYDSSLCEWLNVRHQPRNNNNNNNNAASSQKKSECQQYGFLPIMPNCQFLHAAIMICATRLNIPTHVKHVSSSSPASPLSPSITPSHFHSRLKTHLFHKSFPP